MGYLGWVPAEAEVGDYLHAILGSKVPFVLRPLDQNETNLKSAHRSEYTMVGTSYIHGIVDGEVVEEVGIAHGAEETRFLH
jgi:hypothetical protein